MWEANPFVALLRKNKNVQQIVLLFFKKFKKCNKEPQKNGRRF